MDKKSRTAWAKWIRRLPHYEPAAEYGSEIGNDLDRFAAILTQSDDKTAISSIQANSDGSEFSKSIFSQKQLEQALNVSDADQAGLPDLEVFYVHKPLLQKPYDGVASDVDTRLQVSHNAFRLLMEHCNVTASFVSALAKSYLPPARGFRECEENFTIWYSLPIRVQVKCTDATKSHTKSTAGSNQMNPFHYLHLPEPGTDGKKPHPPLDVRGSQLSVCAHYDAVRGSASVVIVNFMDGRWPRLVEEPLHRIEEFLRSNDAGEGKDPALVHLVFITTVSRWWSNALQSVNEQLIQYEKSLQEELADDDTNSTEFYSIVNKALHAAAAHLHRYHSELEATLDTINFINEKVVSNEASSTAFENADCQLKATLAFSRELEKKIANILALLFNRIQIDHDRRMIANSDAMHKLMLSQQEETAYSRLIAKRSQELAEDMKRDSVSMKTIAILTMFFLPATAFAALLSMPFFTQNLYLADVGKVWIWAVLTIPTTAIAFVFYHVWKRREERKWAARQTNVQSITVQNGDPFAKV